MELPRERPGGLPGLRVGLGEERVSRAALGGDREAVSPRQPPASGAGGDGVRGTQSGLDGGLPTTAVGSGGIDGGGGGGGAAPLGSEPPTAALW